MYDESIEPTIGPRVPYANLDETRPLIDATDLGSYSTQLIVDPRGHAGRAELLVPQASRDQIATYWRDAQSATFARPDCGFSCVSAWHPRGEPTELTTNLASHLLMLERARELDPTARPVAFVAADRSWAEQAVAVSSPAHAQLLAAEFGAPAYVTAMLNRIRVGGTQGSKVAHGRYARFTLPPVCPILAAAEPGQLCRMYGGPWISRSMQAAAEWSEHRELLLTTLGCTVCEDGRFTSTPTSDEVVEGRSGGPISLVHRTCASRWGGPFERGWTTAD